MLPLEQQVTSFEISMKLKELGVPHEESQFVWYRGAVNSSPEIMLRDIFPTPDCILPNNLSIGILCDAFTFSELIKIMQSRRDCSCQRRYGEDKRTDRNIVQPNFTMEHIYWIR